MIRAVVTSVIEGAIKLFSATGRIGETFLNREYFQHCGFTSRPLPGAELILVRDGNHIIAIASDDRRWRIPVEAGEVALYTDEGDKIHFRRGRLIEVVAGTKVKVTAPAVEIVGNVTVTGTLHVTGAISSDASVADQAGTMGEMRTVYDMHTHVDPQGGSTAAPTQVM
jgi:phage gp45-like